MSFFGRRPDDLQQVPVAPDDVQIEKLDGRVADPLGVGLPFIRLPAGAGNSA